MPRRDRVSSRRVSGGLNALTLLNLAGEIPPDSFPALKDTATSAVAIVDATSTFASTSRKDVQSIAEMKTQVHATLTPSDPPLGDANTLDGIDAEQLLARIMEKHTGTTVVARSADRGSESVANRNLSDHVNELAIVRLDGARPVAERSLNHTGSASVSDRSPSSHGANEVVMAQPVVFNTMAASGANVTNVAGHYITYGPDDEQLAAKLKEISALDRLVYAEGASWDPKLVCLPGTRVKILSVIHAWSRSMNASSVLWLNGVAGAGKSAIAHTVAQALRKDGLLASSFFFDRNDASRNTPRLLITTIARDIAVHHPAIAADISAALEEDHSLASASLSRQFEAFISGPLRRHPVDHPIVVVIDALDETIVDDSDTSLLSILRDEASDLPPQLRFLITSRPTWIVEQYLSGQAHMTSQPIDIHSLDNRQDISAYVDSQMRDLLRLKMGPNWPDEAVIAQLKTMAEGLFIWIVTVCNYLRTVYNPRAKLTALLSKSTSQGLHPSEKMDLLYALVLELCADWEDADFREDYDLVIGAIMAAKRPLSLMALKALHGANHPMALSADILLERFGSVLVGFKTDGEPIHMLHVSFREFVTNNANNAEHTRKFYISEKVHSQRLAARCLQTMVREFANGHISGTGYLGRHGDDRPGIPEVIGVSEQLLYSCESWTNHISDVMEPNPMLLEHLRAFVLHHTTVWMEVVSSKSMFLGSLSAFSWLKDHAPEIRGLCDDQSQALALSSLLTRLSYAGRLEEALIAGREAVDLYRALAAERPAVLAALFANSLTNLSICLSAIGRTEEALTAGKEAVNLLRELTIARPAVFNAELARSIANLSICLGDVGQTEEALTAVQEAVDLHRALAAEHPAMSNAPLAHSLSNLSIRLSAVGRAEEALTAVQEVVDIYRALAAVRPDIFNANLARSLTNLSVRSSAVGRTEEVLTVLQEAVDLHRTLAAERPVVFNAYLAGSLTNLSAGLSTVGQAEEALTAAQEAVDLYRTLSAERPAVFNVHLARSLNNISASLSAVGQMEQALTALQEALDLRRTLAAERPAVFNADVARSLASLSAGLSAVGQTEEALTAVQEAVDLYRTLSASRPAVFNAYLARSLNKLSLYLLDVGRTEEALTAVQEGVRLYRTLAEERPALFTDALALSLDLLSIITM